MRRARGAAAVELAVALVALVPALLFALLLHELARARAEAVEAAGAAAWDWAPLDFGAAEAPVPAPSPSVGERAGVGARVRWAPPGVTCEGPEREAALFLDPLFRALAREYGRGGLVRCRAQRSVEVTGAFRRVLPRAGLAPEEAALLTDALAVESGEGVRAGQRTGPFVARVAGAFRRVPTFALHAAATHAFLAEGVARGLLGPEVLTVALRAGALDDPTWPSVALVESPRRTRTPSVRVRQEGTTRHYFSIPWRDWAGDAHARAGEARGPHFLGCRTEGCE